MKDVISMEMIINLVKFHDGQKERKIWPLKKTCRHCAFSVSCYPYFVSSYLMVRRPVQSKYTCLTLKDPREVGQLRFQKETLEQNFGVNRFSDIVLLPSSPLLFEFSKTWRTESWHSIPSTLLCDEVWPLRENGLIGQVRNGSHDSQQPTTLTPDNHFSTVSVTNCSKH